MEFIKNVKGIGRALVIYHGTTNILRLGDFSLIDCKQFKVIGLGELKTSPESDEQIKISAHITAIADIFPGHIILEKETPRSEQSKFHERLKRQIKRMNSALTDVKKTAFEHTTHVSDNMHISEFISVVDKAEKRRAASQKIGDGLVIVAIKIDSPSLSHFYFESIKQKGTSRLKGSERAVAEIVDPSAGPSNSLVIGSFYKFDPHIDSHMPGLVPFFWWPLPIQTLKKVMFGEVLLVTVYNSLHLRRKLVEAGFLVADSVRPTEFTVKHIHEGRTAEFLGLDSMQRLITNYLFHERAVVRIIKGVFFGPHMQSIPANQSAVINLDIQHFI